MQQVVNILPRELTVFLVIMLGMVVLVAFFAELPEDGDIRTVLEGDDSPCPGGEDATHLALHDDECSDQSAGDVCFEGGSPEGQCRERQDSDESELICCQPPASDQSPEDTGQEDAQWRPQHDISQDIQ